MDALGERLIADKKRAEELRRAADFCEREAARLRRQADEIERLAELARAS